MIIMMIINDNNKIILKNNNNILYNYMVYISVYMQMCHSHAKYIH
jgi:hypothetical protein